MKNEIKVLPPTVTETREELLQELRDFFNDPRQVEDLIISLKNIYSDPN
jgi:hypothetical protein